MMSDDKEDTRGAREKSRTGDTMERRDVGGCGCGGWSGTWELTQSSRRATRSGRRRVMTKAQGEREL